MSRLEAVFTGGHKALLPYVTVGYPSLEATRKVVPLLADAGADIIELGVPFSDPLADGATIQNASYHALQNGVTPQACLDMAAELGRKVKTPLVLMTYFNPVLSYGLERFCSACAEAGVSGLIIPDLPPEEDATLEPCTRKHKLDLIYLLAPSSTEARIKLVARQSTGFIYLTSVSGVTGTREKLPDLSSFITRVRQATRQAICVGFGISTAKQAKEVARMADGVIVGSKLIQLMEKDPSLQAVRDFIRELREALNQVSQ